MALRRFPRFIAALMVFAVVGVIASACGGGQEGSESGSENLVVGTTDTVQTLDPAKCYSYYCSNIFQNAGNTLIISWR